MPTVPSTAPASLSIPVPPASPALPKSLTTARPTAAQWASATIDIEFRQSAVGAERTETLFTPRNDNRVGLYETVLDKGEVVVSGCVADKTTFSQTFEFRTGLKAAPDAWHALTVRHDGTDMVVTMDGRTARKKVDLPAVFMNTAILGGAPHTGIPFFTGRVRIIDNSGIDFINILFFCLSAISK